MDWNKLRHRLHDDLDGIIDRIQSGEDIRQVIEKAGEDNTSISMVVGIDVQPVPGISVQAEYGNLPWTIDEGLVTESDESKPGIH